jgi:predicted glycogen debranching enzyme
MKVESAFTWTSPLDGPWPVAYVGGDLERAESEWLITNDVGTYAMSTLALMHTRRQHGLLGTYVEGQKKRHVILSHLEMTLETAGRTHHLSTHQFPDTAPTLGYLALESFTQDPLPRWVYRFPTGTVERTISLVRGHQAVVIALTWTGKQPARLSLRPLLPMRPADELCREHGGMVQRVVLRGGEVEVQPAAHLPPVVLRHSGIFMGSPDWWRKFEYLADRGRYIDFQEDMWSPGVLELSLESRQTSYLVAFVGKPPPADARALVLSAAEEQLSLDENPRLAPEVRSLCVGVETFVLGNGEALVAGYPWLDAWSRDTLLALRGTYLARGQVERAKRTLLGVTDALEDGLLPQRLKVADAGRPDSADATLWLFDVGKSVLDADAGDLEFRRRLLSALISVFDRVERSPGQVLWVTPDGFVENAADYPLTWMDSRVDGQALAPRWGLAVELQALWYRAVCVLSELCEQEGELDVADRARARRDQLLGAFARRFWSHERGYPFDCIAGRSDAAESWTDASIRPNALIALSVAPELFEPWQRQEILARVEERLLTPRGLRTLDPTDPRYMGHAGGTIAERIRASHQGAVWPHLLLYYVRALKHEGGDVERMRDVIQRAIPGGSALGYVPQSADGDAPHKGRGSPAYAIASAMLLEALVLELGIGDQGRTLW